MIDGMKNENMDIAGLPGAAMVLDGICDLMDARVSIGACLASIALPNLKAAGLVSVGFEHTIWNGELTLYGLLRKEKGNAYARYNALLRELVSFEHALAFRLRKSRTEKDGR